jgi:hypothetical protein
MELLRGETPTELVRLALRWAAERMTTEELQKVGQFQRDFDAEEGPDMMLLQGIVLEGGH